MVYPVDASADLDQLDSGCYPGLLAHHVDEQQQEGEHPDNEHSHL